MRYLDTSFRPRNDFLLRMKPIFALPEGEFQGGGQPIGSVKGRGLPIARHAALPEGEFPLRGTAISPPPEPLTHTGVHT